MDNLDDKNVIPMLKHFGINTDELSIEKLEELMKMTDLIKNPADITPEMSKKILYIVRSNTMPVINPITKNITKNC
jgi:hypothetical protein